MRPPRYLLLSLVGAAIGLNGCWRAQESFEIVQMCVGNQQGVAALKNAMEAVARSEGFQFIDGSARQAEGLKAIEADKALKRDVSSAIAFYIEGPKGLGVTASNLGLPRYQVGIGFTEGNDAPRAHRLADQLIGRLSRRWEVQRPAPGTGVLPMKTCGI